MRFADITGQEELKRHLARTVDTGRVSHAQLFTGAAGYGALPLAVACMVPSLRLSSPPASGLPTWAVVCLGTGPKRPLVS